MTRTTRRVVVVGAGMGGLAAAADLARSGAAVTVIERAQTCGGKMRQIMAGGRPVDAGPTVFTMRWIFEGLFADAGVEATVGGEIGPLPPPSDRKLRRVFRLLPPG